MNSAKESATLFFDRFGGWFGPEDPRNGQQQKQRNENRRPAFLLARDILN